MCSFVVLVAFFTFPFSQSLEGVPELFFGVFGSVASQMFGLSKRSRLSPAAWRANPFPGNEISQFLGEEFCIFHSQNYQEELPHPSSAAGGYEINWEGILPREFLHREVWDWVLLASTG